MLHLAEWKTATHAAPGAKEERRACHGEQNRRPPRMPRWAERKTAAHTECQDPASTSPLGSTGNIGGAVTHGVLLTLPAYSHFGRPHTPLRGLIVLAVSVTPGVVSSQLFSHAFAWARCSRGIHHARRGLFAALLTRLCVGSLFSRYPSRPAWSLRGSSHTPLRGLVVLAVSVTPDVVSSRLFSHTFAWARCSRGIRHARRGLFAALLTRLCVGSLFSGVVVAAPVTGIER